MILAQPPPASFDPFDLTNYRWSEPFLWIIAVSSLIFGLFLFASYLKNRKKNLLLWTFGFLGIWIFYHQLIGTGSWMMLFGSFDTGMFGLYTAMLLALIPGFIAAGLCYEKDEKLGLYYTLYVLVMSVAYLCILVSPNSTLIAEAALISNILLILVQLPSAVLIIALPVMKDGPLFPKLLVTIGGVFLITANIFITLVFLMTAFGAPFSPLEGGGIDLMLMLYPFFFTIALLCLFYGLIGTKDYGFDVAHVEFEE